MDEVHDMQFSIPETEYEFGQDITQWSRNEKNVGGARLEYSHLV